MNSYFADTHIRLMNIIVKSTEEIIPVLAIHTDIDEQIHNTVKQIFEFLIKVIKNLPDFLIKDFEFYKLKIKLFNRTNTLIQSWVDFKDKPDDFLSTWRQFADTWDIMYKQFEKADISDYVSYIPAN